MAIGLSLLASCSLSLLWSMLNTLQLIVHLPLFSVVHPSNALYFYILLFGVANFTPIDVSETTSKAFDFTPSEEAHTLNFRLLGYESKNAIENLGNNFLVLLFAIGMIMLIFALEMIINSRFCRDSKLLKWILQALRKQFMFSFILRLVLETYLEICICVLINLKNLQKSTAGDRFATSTTAILSVIVIFLPPVLAVFCTLYRNHLYDPLFVQRFGALFESLDPNRSISVMYFPAFTLHRLLFAWTAVFLVDSAIYQIQVFCLCSIFYSIYLVTVRPFSSVLMNNVEIINELAVSLFAVGLYLLTPIVIDGDIRLWIGWGLIGLTSATMIMNIIVVISTSIKTTVIKLRSKKTKKSYLKDLKNE